MTVGQKIRQLRKERGMKQERLAKIFGNDQHVISDWETGRYKPSLGSVRRLLNVFDISFEEFMEGVEI